MPRFHTNLIDTQMVAVKNLTLVSPQIHAITRVQYITPRRSNVEKMDGGDEKRARDIYIEG